MSPRRGPSDAELLRRLCDVEGFDKTLEGFPTLTRAALVNQLEALADSLEPRAVPSPAPVEHAPSPSPTPVEGGGTYSAVRVYSDGAARGNPGPAGAGAVITAPDGRILERLGKFLGKQTNNVAEYQGVLLGLRRARELGVRAVEVYADSQLMIRQLGGIYQVKNAGLKPLHSEAVAMLKGFSKVKLVHIPREMNKDADEMSNRAIDERM